MKPLRPRLGAHLSVSGGMDRMARRARDLGCEAAQVFSRSPRGGQPREFGPAEVAETDRILSEADVRPLVVHVPYTVNPATVDEGLREYAVTVLRGEIARASVLGAAYVVTHMGRTGRDGASVEEGLRRAAEVFEAALAGTPGCSSTVLLLENTAGSDRELGARLEDLAASVAHLSRLFPGRVGVCLDTCHAHASGYDLGGPDAVRRFLSSAMRLFSDSAPRLVHANDSAALAGSRVDRHARIGEGTIGEEGFAALLGEPWLAECPFIVETPGRDEDRATDIERLRRLRDRASSGPERESDQPTGRRHAGGPHA